MRDYIDDFSDIPQAVTTFGRYAERMGLSVYAIGVWVHVYSETISKGRPYVELSFTELFTESRGLLDEFSIDMDLDEFIKGVKELHAHSLITVIPLGVSDMTRVSIREILPHENNK